MQVRLTQVGQVVAAAIVMLALVAPVSAAVVGTTTWDDGTMGGWTHHANSYGYWEVSTSGGNPGGFVQFYDMTTNYTADQIHAPAAYLGDLGAIANGRFEWDMSAGRAAAIGPRITMKGPGTLAFYEPEIPGTAWSHAGVDLVESAWVVSQGTWASLMANVTDIVIQGDICVSHPGVELKLDNFALTPEPATIFFLAISGLWFVRRR